MADRDQVKVARGRGFVGTTIRRDCLCNLQNGRR
jgi:hypothetical protein